MAKPGLAHLLATLGIVTIAFAQQLVRALDFLADEAHRRHGPIPLELVGDGRKDERNRGAAIDGRRLSGEVIDQNAAHLLDVNIGDSRVQSVPSPSPGVAGHVAKRLVVRRNET